MQQTKATDFIITELDSEKPDFQGVVAQALGETLSRLGLPKNVLYSFVLQERRLSIGDTDDEVDGFVFALERVFGPGALIVEIEFMRNIKRQFPSFRLVVKDQGSLDFQGYLLELKRFLDAC